MSMSRSACARLQSKHTSGVSQVFQHSHFFVSLALCILCLGCAHRSDRQTDAAIDRVIADPIGADGQVFDLVLYPYAVADFQGARYVLCYSPCSSRREAARSVSRFIPLRPGQYDSFHGDRPVRVRARFVADCFREDAVCADIAWFIWLEVP